jgi:hypothetical protein
VIDGIIMASLGGIFSLIGYRVIQFPSSARFDPERWHAKNGRLFRLGGPALMVIGTILAIAASQP